jgi:hypothetical protein
MADSKKFKYGPMSIAVEGVGDLKNKLFQMQEEKQLVPALRNALSAGGGAFKESMTASSPVETGWLQSHFRVTNAFINLKRNIASIWVGPQLKQYTRPSVFLKSGKRRKGIGGKATKDGSGTSPAMIAAQIELGTHHMHQNTFMHRAISRARSEALSRVVDKLQEMVRNWLSLR